MGSMLIIALSFCAVIFAQSSVVDQSALAYTGVLDQYTLAQQSVVDRYIATESPIAKAGLLANIGPSGSKSSGAKAGVVIASPTPIYLFAWIRDSSLVFKNIIDRFTRGEDPSLRVLIDQFLESQTIIQQVSNPSGTVSTGGLGEPKFNIDMSAFRGDWRRPQHDGPALRSTAFITYANWLISNSNMSFVTSKIWPVLKLDLDYTATRWNQSTVDLWEEVLSSSFFTTAIQHRALREGAALASKIGQTSVVARYNEQADNILCFLQSYWNPSEHFITANTGGGRSGKDANSVLASIHTFDPDAGCDAATFQPCSDKALSSLKVYVDSFRPIYGINFGISSKAAVATGRYPEDEYVCGNPWYLSVFAVAEQLYDSLFVWKQQGSLTVTSTSLAFFRQIFPTVTIGTFSSSTSTFRTLTTDIQTFADGFLAINTRYTPPDGGLFEQFHRNTGAPSSVADLTWSYAAALTSFTARKGVAPSSWGARGLVVPAVCHSDPGPTVQVTFNVFAQTQPGENIFLAGSLDALKLWSPDKAIALSAASYPTWSVTVTLPANTLFKYKYIRKSNRDVTWESDPNNQQTTPASGSSTFTDTWR